MINALSTRVQVLHFSTRRPHIYITYAPRIKLDANEVENIKLEEFAGQSKKQAININLGKGTSKVQEISPGC